MRRTNTLLNIISVAVLAALVIYFVFSAINTRNNPLKTTLAVTYTIDDSVSTSGYAVCEETVVSGGSNMDIVAENGKKVSKDEVIAERYNSADSLETANQIYSLSLQAKQLEAELNTTGTDTKQEAKDNVLALSYAVRTGDFSDLSELLLGVRTYVLNEGSGTDQMELQSKIDELNQQIETLQSSLDTDTVSVTAPAAGIYSSTVDGLEKVTPEMLSTTTPSTLDSLFASPDAVPDDCAGKVITGMNWYYAAVLDEEDADKLEEGTTAEIHFTKNYSATVSMTVESISAPEDGKCVVVFSYDSGMADIAGLRTLTGDIIFSEQTGIRIPKEAVRLDEDGNPMIYTLVGAKAKAVSVTILAEFDEYYLVSDSDRSDLHEGTEVIVKAKNLYDGKVVQ